MHHRMQGTLGIIVHWSGNRFSCFCEEIFLLFLILQVPCTMRYIAACWCSGIQKPLEIKGKGERERKDCVRHVFR